MNEDRIEVYLEVGAKRVIAGAIRWPGWTRGARDEAGAFQALFDYAPRYAQALLRHVEGPQLPASPAHFVVVERLAGNATTDFGAPGMIPTADHEPVDGPELARLQAILLACWETFDAAVKAAHGKDLRKGPRGGGRDPDQIIRHVTEAEQGYLRMLGHKPRRDAETGQVPEPELTRQDTLEGLLLASRSELPFAGPRGGTRWPVRYFVRREAWHALDHAWEIEDRVEAPG